MKIATFNLKNLFGIGYYSSYDQIIEVTPDLLSVIIENRNQTIHTLNADILVVQEIGSREVLDEIATLNKLNYFIAKADERGISNGVLYKQAEETTSLSDVAGLPVFYTDQLDTLGNRLTPYREFIYLRAEYADRPLHILGVHLKSSSKIHQKTKDGKKLPLSTQADAGDALIRTMLYKLSQARRLREIVDTLFARDPEAQILVLGDFNAECFSEIMTIIQGGLNQPLTQLTDLCKMISPEKKFSCIWKDKKLLLDHILISPSLQNRVENLKIFNEEISSSDTLKSITSDHAPLMVTLV